MTEATVIDALFGAALVAIGVLASALADRIRGIRAERRTQECEVRSTITGTIIEPEPPRSSQKSERATRAPRSSSVGGDSLAGDVITALVAAGYKRPIATEAVWSCDLQERSSAAAWTRAALRRCASGGPS